MASNISNAKGNISKMKELVSSEKVKARFNEMLGKAAGTFLASVLDLYSSDSYLTNCDATKVLAECMKAAALGLPISKALGFAYIVPYKNKNGEYIPNFMLGYKGLIQLAQRSGKYRFINADMVYEGEDVSYDRITGTMEISGKATSDKVVGYFSYFQLLNGFEKCIYWDKEKVEAHAKRYSKAWSKQDSPWHTQFDAMALKTMLKNNLSKYGVMTVEFADAITVETEDKAEKEAEENANTEVFPFDDGNGDSMTVIVPTPEKEPQEQVEQPQIVVAEDDFDPGF